MEKVEIETKAIKKDNVIKYTNDGIIYILKINDGNIELFRESDVFKHHMEFALDKETFSNYFIKEYSSNIKMKIKTENILNENNLIIIEYTILETQNKYKYYLNCIE